MLRGTRDARLEAARILVACAGSLLLGCGQGGADQDAIRDSAVPAPPAPVATLEPPSCDPAPGGLRVTPTRIGGIPVGTTLRQLRALCPRAAREKAEDAHHEQLALRVDYPGASVVATFSTSADDPKDDAAPQGWTASGDSVRFPDGTLLPRTLGALRQLDSLGTMMPSDVELLPENTFVKLCRFPDLLIEVGPGARRPSDGEPWPFRIAARDDTARVVSLFVSAESAETDLSSWWRGGCR